jgi:hypothetical protein
MAARCWGRVSGPLWRRASSGRDVREIDASGTAHHGDVHDAADDGLIRHGDARAVRAEVGLADVRRLAPRGSCAGIDTILTPLRAVSSGRERPRNAPFVSTANTGEHSDGACKTPITGSNPVVASIISNLKTAVSGSREQPFSSFDSNRDSNPCGRVWTIAMQCIANPTPAAVLVGA